MELRSAAPARARGNRLPPIQEITPSLAQYSGEIMNSSSNDSPLRNPTFQGNGKDHNPIFSPTKPTLGELFALQGTPTYPNRPLSEIKEDSNNQMDEIFSKSKQNHENLGLKNDSYDSNNKNEDGERLNPKKFNYKEYVQRLSMRYKIPEQPQHENVPLPDFILVYDSCKTTASKQRIQHIFENALKKETITVNRRIVCRNTYVELRCGFDRLCVEAEHVVLQMPLADSVSLVRSAKKSWVGSHLETDHEDDCISIPFSNSMKGIFENIDDKEQFFRPSIRSLLIRNILQNIDLSWQANHSLKEDEQMEALNLMLHHGVYNDAFVPHERSALDVTYPLPMKPNKMTDSTDSVKRIIDRRRELNDRWLLWWKYQPLQKIRDYFGEKIALYFAWLGMLITSLWIPTLVGIIVTIAGIVKGATGEEFEISINRAQVIFRRAVDNDFTPYFAFFVCLWGTVFLELWKRKNAELAYKWDVDDFELQEPDRPQFYGTETRRDPITGKLEQHYPPVYKALKSMGSFSLIVFMVFLVIASLLAVIVFRVISRVEWFPPPNGEVLASVTSAILNSASIIIMDRVYKHVAIRLTNWENHRTNTQYNDSLILKLFGFQFVNSYSSLYYIAFFREISGNFAYPIALKRVTLYYQYVVMKTSKGIFQQGSKYTDDCGLANDCLSLLSLQVAVLMVMKPMPKLFIDIIVPWIRRTLRKCKRKKPNRISSVSSTGGFEDNTDGDLEYEEFLEMERKKPPVGDFTLSEYTEKVLQYGYLMIFAAAFPLAPLIALITNIVDLRVDAKRLLWLNRKPIADRAQDIGMWHTILELLNLVGVVTNAFLVGVTSDYGRQYVNQTIPIIPVNSTVEQTVTVTTYRNLWIIIIFQNVVFAVKFLLAYSIPDVPEHVETATKKERYEIDLLLKRAGLRRGPRKSIAPSHRLLCANYSSFNMNVITPENVINGAMKNDSSSSFVSAKDEWPPNEMKAINKNVNNKPHIRITGVNLKDNDDNSTQSTIDQEC